MTKKRKDEAKSQQNEDKNIADNQQLQNNINSEQFEVDNGISGLSKDSKEHDQPIEKKTEQEFNKLNAEVELFKDKYLRTVAEMENMRKRMERERSEVTKYALEGIIQDLLDVLDCFDRAISTKTAPDISSVKKTTVENQESQAVYLEGIQMIRKRFFEVLTKHGLQPIQTVGEKFDPNLHQAIQRIESEEINSESIVEEFSKGYLLNGRLLRAAMVGVAIPSEKPN